MRSVATGLRQPCLWDSELIAHGTARHVHLCHAMPCLVAAVLRASSCCSASGTTYLALYNKANNSFSGLPAALTISVYAVTVHPTHGLFIGMQAPPVLKRWNEAGSAWVSVATLSSASGASATNGLTSYQEWVYVAGKYSGAAPLATVAKANATAAYPITEPDAGPSGSGSYAFDVLVGPEVRRRNTGRAASPTPDRTAAQLHLSAVPPAGLAR